MQKAIIVKMRLKLKGQTKPVSSIVVGISPELEIALYTLCFMARPNKLCHLNFNESKFAIQTHTFNHGEKRLIATAYVKL